MKRKTKSTLFTILILIAIVAFAIIFLTKKPPETDEEVVKCIASKSTIYTQFGCRACDMQKEMFGENSKYLNEVNCFYDRQACEKEEILATPTWISGRKRVEGIQSIEKLRELTGC